MSAKIVSSISIPISRDGVTSIFDTRSFFVRHDGMGAHREFTNIRVVVSKKKGLRVNRGAESPKRGK